MNLFSKMESDLKGLINRVQNIKDKPKDVSILMTSPVERLKPGKMIMINLPGNATSLTNDAGEPKDEEKIRELANEGKNDFFEFINQDSQSSMRMNTHNAETVACYYSRKVNHLIEEYNETGKLHESFAPFADMFDDLISKDGQRLSVKEATDNMRNVVLRGHCFGTLVISELEHYLFTKLTDLGYGTDECTQILSAPTAIFSSSPVDIDKQPTYFKVVAYANCADKFIPTIKGSPNYKALAGFSDEDVVSDERKIKKLKIGNKPNYRLLVCSSLEFPSVSELREFIINRLNNPSEKDIVKEMQKIYKGHAMSAISNILKKSPFMKMLRQSVREMMAEEVTSVVLMHHLQNKVHGVKLGNIGLTKAAKQQWKTARKERCPLPR